MWPRCELYTGLDTTWPKDTDAKGIPRVIGIYDGLTRDNSWNWPRGCVE